MIRLFNNATLITTWRRFNETYKCSKCNSNLNFKSAYCPSCGRKFTKTKIIAIDD